MINHDLFRNSTVYEIMKENFIIVQHFVSQKSDKYPEGQRLYQLYGCKELSYLAIINPLTGSESCRCGKSDFENPDHFMEFCFPVSPF